MASYKGPTRGNLHMSVILGRWGGGRLRQTGLSSFMTPPGTRGGTPADVERRAIFGRTTVGPTTTVDSVNEEVLSGLELNDDL